MIDIPDKCLIDTNIPVTANLARNPSDIPKELINCVDVSIEVIEGVVKNGGLVIDDGDEIFDEYRNKLSLKGQPGIGDKFVKWVHDRRWTFPDEDRVKITKNGLSYNEFPNHEGLKGFDNSDRKFVAVSNAHNKKPPIIQATDSKWWGWKDALAEVGIIVQFLDPEYIKSKYDKKMNA